MALSLAYLLTIFHLTKTHVMITSIEIAKILFQQKKKAKNKTRNFDTAILNLGVATIYKKKNK